MVYEINVEFTNW